MSSYMTKEITTALKDYYVRANETERIILNSALAARPPTLWVASSLGRLS